MRKVIDTLKYILIVSLSLLVFISFYTLVSVKIFGKDYVSFFGYTYFAVASGSMSPTIETNDIIIVKINGTYKKGDIITYKSKNDFITHRVTNIFEKTINTKGDFNNTEDNTVNKEDVLGKVVLIIPSKVVVRILGVILLIIVGAILVNFEDIFKKFVVKDKKLDENSPLDYTMPIEVNEVEKALMEEMLSKTKGISAVRLGNDGEKKIELKLNKKVIDKKEEAFTERKEMLKEILSLLSGNNSKKAKITKAGAIKLKYLYKITKTISLNTEHVEEIVDDPPFEEVYNYDFEEIGFTKTIRNKLYEMPLYAYILIMIYAIVYDDNYFFDAMFKMFKYRIKLDVKGDFLKDKHKIDKCMKLMESIIDATGKKDAFEIEKVVDLVKLDKKFD